MCKIDCRYHKMENQKVTVIIPVYNAAMFLERCILSILNQSYLNIELILVDNNSDDGSLEIINSFVAKYPEKIFFFREKKKGASATRNRGLAEATGSWIQFLDADDFLKPKKIESQLKVIDDETSLVVGNYIRISKNISGKVIEKAVCSANSPWIGLIESKLGKTSSNLFRKDAVNEVNGWNENLGSSQEYDLMFRILKHKSSVKYSDDFDTLIYKIPGSISKPKMLHQTRNILYDRIELRKSIKLYLTERGIFSKDAEAAYSKFLYKTLWDFRFIDKQYFKRIMQEEKVAVPLYFYKKEIVKIIIKRLLRVDKNLY